MSLRKTFLRAFQFFLIFFILSWPMHSSLGNDRIDSNFSPKKISTSVNPDTPALIKIKIKSLDDLFKLQATGLQIFTHQFNSDGTSYVLALASPVEQDDLKRLGFEPNILSSHAGQATYYLLFGDSDVLSQVRSYASILDVEGSQILIQSTPNQVKNLSTLKLEIQALEPHPIVIPERSGVESISYPILPDPTVQEIIDQVDPTTLSTYVGDLSGEWPVIVGSEPYTITTRNTRAITPTEKATQFALEHFQSLGLAVSYFDFVFESDQERNVVAEQVGLTQPDKIFLITAHLDSTSQTPNDSAPGADDNASGSTAVMVAADILSQYDFNCTLRYVLFTGEEQGLHGSKAYAAYLFSQGEEIAGVLNLDMIAYDLDDAPILDLHARSALPDSIVIANTFEQVVTQYDLGLIPDILVDNYLGDYSDNKSFWDYGYSAILGIEDYDDFTPYYHTTSDRLSTLNIAYFTEFVKAALATLVHMEGTYNPPFHTVYMPFVVTASP